MTNTVVLDLFLGDSGKGKIVDYLASTAAGVIRFNGSNNAGHTLKVNNQVFKTHAVPSGVLYKHTTNFIGHGCIIDPFVLNKEIQDFKKINPKIFISGNAHIILPYHIALDTFREQTRGIGSTKRGVSPAYEAKAGRYGLQYRDLFLSRQAFENKLSLIFDTKQTKQALEVYDQLGKILRPHIIEDSIEFIHDLASKGSLVFEGAQGTYLDIDIGEYPFVTSSNCTIGAVLTGTGLNLKQIHQVIGVVKAYGSYVGTNNTFNDIQQQDLNDKLCELGQEYGTTTGRRRRLCWLDLDKINTAIKINGPDKLVITRMDTLGQLPKVFLKHNNELIEFSPWGDLQNIKSYSELPSSAQHFLNYIENTTKSPIWAIGTGASRDQLLFRKD